MINYQKIENSDKKSFDGFFNFQGRIIWYYTYTVNDLKMNIYLDERLKTEESNDYLNRVERLPDKYNMENFYEKQYHFGTIAMLHNTNKDPEKVYINYKSRMQIENMIDIFKNILEADSSYMQNEQALETWMFVNYIALHWYYIIYQLLVKFDLIKKVSPMDFIIFLKEVRKVKINSTWKTAEITNKTQKLLDKLKIHIT